jgi:hypothetical protein
LCFDAAHLQAREVTVAMIVNGSDGSPNVDTSARARRDDTPYDVVVICLWFVLGVVVIALIAWLALGGQI